MAAKPKKTNDIKTQNETQRYLKKVQEWISNFAELAVLLFFTLFLFTLIIPGFYKWISWKGFIRRIQPYDWALLAYAPVLIISTIFADSRHIAIESGSTRYEGLRMMFAYFCVYVLVGRLYRPKEGLDALCVLRHGGIGGGLRTFPVLWLKPSLILFPPLSTT
ncbi:MAG: hypothetical protein VB051_03550 [Candidatus Pelethousia sp.]|nr:hypothetical protein [Candidatus Pelethousia sp.]